MSPSGTMVRVYAELKRRIMDGDLKPGMRLDPTKLGKEMLASMTPIRDALHQLRGEGLVENWQHEGFWIADLSETVIRDRYLWCNDLVFLCLRAASDRPAPVIVPDGDTYADTVTYVLLRIASLSINQEHWRAMVSVCDRTYLLRRIEAQLLDDPFKEVTPLARSVEARNWSEGRAGYERFHESRMQIVPQIAASLRTR